MKYPQKKRHLSSSQIIIIGFAALIFVGSLLLTLPFSSASGRWTGFGDSLFTATSAVCVTGLVVQDTATYWSPFGHLVILALIQIGGMGVVTMGIFVALLSGKKIGLMQRSTMQEAIAAPKVGGIIRLTNFILRTSAAIELAGAALLAPVFCRKFGLRGLWYALFHSVSAFCNAGFDLMGGTEKFSSLTSFQTNPLVNLAVMLLVIIGGIGFMTWDDVRTNRGNLKKYRMQSKVIFMVSAILIVFPALFFFFYEFSQPQWSGLTFSGRVWGALFQSVTTRTAGFNTVNLANMSEAGKFLMIPLMLIGGSPGSTAGGIKTTTLAIMVLAALSVFSRREDTQCFGRRIDSGTVKSAAAILVLYLVLFLFASVAISCLEGLPILTAMFESASALGTVGVTLGVTPQLGMVSRLILILMMYMGRVGGLTLIFAAVSGYRKNLSKLPVEKITVG